MNQSAYQPPEFGALNPGQNLSAAQLRYVTMHKMVVEEFKYTDQYVVVTPNGAPEQIKILTAEHAAQMIYDKQGRLASEDEVKEFKLKLEAAKNEAQRNIDRNDLAKSVQRVLRD